MKFILALIAAYLIVGLVYVRYKLAANDYLRMPLFLVRYCDEGGGVGRLVAVILSWPIANSSTESLAIGCFLPSWRHPSIACQVYNSPPAEREDVGCHARFVP